MAVLTLDRKKLQSNYKFIDKRLKKHGIEWGVVTKLLCGYKPFLQEIVHLGVKELHDSRISNLKAIKELNPGIQTVYIKPPAKRSIPNVVRYADVSLNTELKTIEMLSQEAQKQNKVHKILIMIELGDLREGVLGENLLHFYEQVFHLPNIQVVGIGANLNCLYGVMPSHDKLIQLSLYKQLIEAKFNRQIPWVSGGTSVVFPLLQRKLLPKGVNHFRIGELLYFGLDLFNEETIPGMHDDVFQLHAEIIEIQQKPVVPIGELAANPSGEVFEVNEEDYGKKSVRAIIDVGLLETSPDYLIPYNEHIQFAGASSDMIVLDLGDNQEGLKVGDTVAFKLKYMGALGLLNSRYIDKKVVE